MLVRSARIVFLASLLLVTAGISLHGQISGDSPGVTLTGRIQDPQSKAIPGATVTAYPRVGGPTASASTNSSGEYQLHLIAPGEYLLQVEANGFASVVEPSVQLNVAHPLEKNFRLDIAGGHDEVTVTASGTPQTTTELSKTVLTIDHSEIQEREALSIGSTVALSPGIRVQQAGGPGAITTIRLRGMRDQDTAVLIDGLTLRDPGAIQGNASGFFSDLMLPDADRVEILNGAASSLYGTSAMGGVLNIITDQGGGPTRFTIGADGGSLASIRGRASVSGSALRDRLFYSSGVSYWNVLRGVDGDDAFRSTSAQGHASYRITNSTSISARLFAADAFAKFNSDPIQLEGIPATGVVKASPFVTFQPGVNNPDATRASRFLSGAMILNGQPTARLNYSVSFQTIASSRRYGDGPAGSGFQPLGSTRSLFDGRLQTTNARVNYQLGSHNLISGGYQFENENFAFDYLDRSDPGSPSSLNATQRSHSAFVQDQARLFGGRLSLSGALRVQSFDFLAPTFNPSAMAPYQGVKFATPPTAYTGDTSAAYVFRSTGTKVRAHLGRGYRAPSLYERFGASFDSFFGYSQFGDPRIAPERSISFDTGIDQTFFRKRATISATYFYTQLQQTIGFGLISGADPFGRFFGYRNLQGGLSRGAEVSARASITRTLDVSAAYTFVNAVENTPLVDNILRRFVLPRHQFSLFATKRMGQRWLVTFDTLQSGTYLAPIFSADFTQRVYEFDGIRRLNAGASYRVSFRDTSAARFYVRGENLTGQDYYESGFRTPGRTALAGIQFEF